MFRWLTIVLCIIALSQPGCFWKLWKKDKAPKEKVYDVYGNVAAVQPDEIVISTKKGSTETFTIDAASIKGGDFEPGAYVHVYYKVREEGKVVTMVVEKIK